MALYSKPYAGNIILKRTCYACPEQYDAIVEDTDDIVGYLRLRHGHFTVQVPDVNGEFVYESYPAGDGMFEEDEREEELLNATAAIIAWYNKEDSNVD